MSGQEKVKGIKGECCKEASAILNLSQGVPSHSQAAAHGNLIGHPRFHVLCSKNFNKAKILNNIEALGCTEVVTGQQNNTKTAFLNREDQNKTLHEILTAPYGKEALNLLNNGKTEVILKTSTNILNENKNLKMAVVSSGNKIEQKPANSTVLLLGHHENKPEGMFVHVKTFYPSDQYVDNYFLNVIK